MKRVVLRLDLHDDQEKQKAIKAVSTLFGVDSIAMDMKEKKMTVVGSVDPVDVVGKLRKLWHAEILSVGPAKDGDKKEDGEKKKAEGNKQVAELVAAYRAYDPRLSSHYYYVHSAEEDPNSSCVIC